MEHRATGGKGWQRLLIDDELWTQALDVCELEVLAACTVAIDFLRSGFPLAPTAPIEGPSAIDRERSDSSASCSLGNSTWCNRCIRVPFATPWADTGRSYPSRGLFGWAASPKECSICARTEHRSTSAVAERQAALAPAFFGNSDVVSLAVIPRSVALAESKSLIRSHRLSLGKFLEIAPDCLQKTRIYQPIVCRP